MGFLTNLLGSDNAYLTALIALGVVVVLIIVGVWILKLVSDASRNTGRGRSRRLGVVDSVALDQRRQAVLLRRDNVEHLIITGGPQDVVVETMIVPPAQPARQSPPPARQASRSDRPAEPRAPEPRTELRGRTETPPAARPRAAADMARGRNTLRNTGVLRPVSQGEAASPGSIGKNGLRRPTDSGNADDRYGDDEQDPADYQTADMDGERDHYQSGDGR